MLKPVKFYKIIFNYISLEKVLLKDIKSSTLIILTAIFLVSFCNISFFSHIIEVYPLAHKNIAYVSSLAVLLISIIIILLTLICSRYTTKPVLIGVVLASALVAYVMDNYSIVVDAVMIQNIVETSMGEVSDLLNLKLFLYFLCLGLLPTVLIYKAKINYGTRKSELISKIKVLMIFTMAIIVIVFSFGKFYASFIREHKSLRYYSNPVYYIYSSIKYINSKFAIGPIAVAAIGKDARIPVIDNDRELVILVLGETARADRFSLNGYEKETNPLLKKENVISFTNFYSCGTSTALSVPCMFSVHDSSRFNIDKAQATENLLDVLHHAGVSVLWRDNNSDSKGVAVRVPYESFKYPDTNTVCDVECRDEGMLVGLQKYIDRQIRGDIFIVLHQMGNHGPAYYKRYPEMFERFKPVCKSSQMEACSSGEINNTYDNAILYTDYFLSRVIALLKQNTGKFETAMLYVSDHGESLGDGGIYLHGLPYFMAPDAQIHIPAILWFGDSFHIDIDSVKNNI